MDGFEMCTLIRQDPLTSHIPLIMLTAKSNEGDRAASYNCGADAFISKPFSVKTLTTRIEGLIESRIKLQKLYRDRILSSPSEIVIESENDKFILKLIKVIEENLENPDFNIQTLCESIDSSYQYVYRKVKALTGETINDFVRTIKLKRAAQYLCKGELRISEILYKSGFNSHSYFTKCFKGALRHDPEGVRRTVPRHPRFRAKRITAPGAPQRCGSGESWRRLRPEGHSRPPLTVCRATVLPAASLISASIFRPSTVTRTHSRLELISTGKSYLSSPAAV